MTQTPESMTVDQFRKLHELCWQFEDAWHNGADPRIEDWLTKSDDQTREALLAELIEVELELRCPNETVAASVDADCDTETNQAGVTQIMLTEMQQRFPDHQHVVTSAFARFAHSQQPQSADIPQDSRYEFLNEIDRGGAGIVWRVFDRHLKREMALKLLLESQNTPDMRRRLELEARLCGRLEHPGVVPVHELSRLDDGRPYIAMKLVDGKTLAELLAPAAATPQRQLLDVFHRACHAIAYAHRQNIIHRDLKPGNIMVGAFDEVQVMDWGLGKDLTVTGDSEVFSQASSPLDSVNTLIGTVFGTPAYMSPEQARGEINRIDQRSDVFSLGAILCEILTGGPPYEVGTTDLHEQARAANLTAAMKRIESSAAAPELIRLTMRCLSVNPDDRPNHAGEVIDALALALTKQPANRLFNLKTFGASLLAVMIVVVISRGRSDSRKPDLPFRDSVNSEPIAAAVPDPAALCRQLKDALRQSSLEDVQQRYGDILDKQPEALYIQLDMIVFLLNKRRFQEGQRLCERLIQIDDAKPQPHLHLAYAHYQQGRFVDAVNSASGCLARHDAERPSKHVAEPWLKKYQRAVELDRRLPELLAASTAVLSLDDCTDLAEVCECKGDIESALHFHLGRLGHPQMTWEMLLKVRPQFIMYFAGRYVHDLSLTVDLRNRLCESAIHELIAMMNEARDRFHSIGRDDATAKHFLTCIDHSRAAPGFQAFVNDDLTPQNLRQALQSIWQESERLRNPE
ncbi:MAG: serine/threonine-protein kinase [Planctomycetaceae bacterium]